MKLSTKIERFGVNNRRETLKHTAEEGGGKNQDLKITLNRIQQSDWDFGFGQGGGVEEQG